jgi:hypothetical protein
MRIAQVAFVLAAALAGNASVATAQDSYAQRKEGGRTCLAEHVHTASGPGATKPAARAAAIRAWIEYTNDEYGRAWASFGNAAGSATRYTKEASGWSATIDARPCRR